MIATPEMIRIDIIDSINKFQDLESDWNELLSQSKADNIFLRWEWLFCWWQVFGQNSRLHILLIRENDKLIGIGPFYIRNEVFFKLIPVGIVDFIGSQHVGSDYLDLICIKGKEELITNAILKCLVDNKFSEFISFAHINKDSKTIKYIEGYAKNNHLNLYLYKQTKCPYIDLPSSWEAFLDSLSKNKKKNLKYYWNRFFKKNQQSRFVVMNKNNYSEDYFDKLVELNKKRMVDKKIKNLSGTFFNEDFQLFHRKVIPHLLDNNLLDLVFLESDGKLIGVKYNFRYKNKVYSYQVGMESDAAKDRIGSIIICNSIQEGIKNKLSEYDFLQGTESYKYYWTKKERLNVSYYIYDHSMKAIFLVLMKYKFKTSLKKLISSVYAHAKN
jgi:CelD/BcsL family acetyltransferase involved in cellulose biosynthesis